LRGERLTETLVHLVLEETGMAELISSLAVLFLYYDHFMTNVPVGLQASEVTTDGETADHKTVCSHCIFLVVVFVHYGPETNNGQFTLFDLCDLEN
jgi:hypothetical protein